MATLSSVGITEQQVRFLFHDIDANKDGGLDRREIRTFFGRMTDDQGVLDIVEDVSTCFFLFLLSCLF